MLHRQLQSFKIEIFSLAETNLKETLEELEVDEVDAGQKLWMGNKQQIFFCVMFFFSKKSKQTNKKRKNGGQKKEKW